MPRKKVFLGLETLDIVFYVFLAILFLWIIKNILGYDPPENNLFQIIPWISLGGGIGAAFEKIRRTARDTEKLNEEIKEIRKEIAEVRERLGRMEGILNELRKK